MKIKIFDNLGLIQHIFKALKTLSIIKKNYQFREEIMGSTEIKYSIK